MSGLTKDNMIEKIDSGEIQSSVEACIVSDKYCLVNALFKKIPVSELSSLKEMLFDDNFVSIMKDSDLVSCVDAFFANNLNISETSKNAFLHRNTLVYRIDKIHRLTGFNLRNFSDAVTFKILIMIFTLFN